MLQIENFCVILRLKIADPTREGSNEKWKRLQWAIWGPMKIENGRNEWFEAQRKMKMAEMKRLSPNEN